MTSICSNLTSSLCSGSSVIGCSYDNLDQPLSYSPQDLRFFNCINSELLHRVAAQSITYYPILEKYTQTNFYNESKKKVWGNPIKLYARVEWQEPNQTFNQFNVDEKSILVVYFDKYDLMKHDLNPSVGDFVEWSEKMFEIRSLTEWQPVLGMQNENILIKATCGISRENQFNADQEDEE